MDPGLRAVSTQPDREGVDHGLGEWVSPAGDAPFDPVAALRRHDSLLAQDRWTVGRRDEHGPELLYTFLDLTDEEIDDVRPGGRNLRAEVNSALDGIRPILEAIAVQTRAFFDDRLPQALAEQIEARRTRLEGRRRIADSLGWPDGWKAGAPGLEPVVPTARPASAPASGQGSPRRTPTTTPSEAAGPGDDAALEPARTAAPGASTAADDLKIGPPKRLADATFNDLLRTMRVWADAVEGHPTAYRGLAEERLSDLLAATLNAALPGAHREVYRRSGKTDLYVTAEILATGAGPAKVFVCECKKWTGRSAVAEALDQLLGYLNGTDTAAVLCFFVPNIDSDAVFQEAMIVLRARNECEGDDVAPVSGWPVLRLRTSTGLLRLCVVFVNLPPARSAADRKARSE